LSICFCAAVFVVKMPPTTSQSVVVDEALDDVEGVEGVEGVVVVIAIDCNTGVDVVVWPGLVTFVGMDESVPPTPATVPKVVVG
jgi:hypothetical protein